MHLWSPKPAVASIAVICGLLAGAGCGAERSGNGEVAILPADKGAPYTVPEPDTPTTPRPQLGTTPTTTTGLTPTAPSTPSTPATPASPTTASKPSSLERAATAAGCKLLSPAIEGADHTDAQVTYGTNPPSSGEHNPVPAPDGTYDPGKTPPKENLVHTLEHGRVEVQYAPGTPPSTVAALERLVAAKFRGSADYHVLLFQNGTGMPYRVAAVAWGHILGCPRYDARTAKAVSEFRLAYTDKGPEFIP